MLLTPLQYNIEMNIQALSTGEGHILGTNFFIVRSLGTIFVCIMEPIAKFYGLKIRIRRPITKFELRTTYKVLRT